MKIKAKKTSLLPDIITYFKAKNLKLVGQGFHAAVFQSRKTNEVIKVFRNDGCYTLFLNTIAQNQSPHFPQIKSYVQLKGRYAQYHIVKMEKLKSKLQDLNSDQELLDNIMSVAECYLHLKQNKDVKHSKFRLENTLKDFVANNKSLCNALHILAQTLHNTPCSWDFTPENIMRREDGVIVIIDPFASFG